MSGDDEDFDFNRNDDSTFAQPFTYSEKESVQQPNEIFSNLGPRFNGYNPLEESSDATTKKDRQEQETKQEIKQEKSTKEMKKESSWSNWNPFNRKKKTSTVKPANNEDQMMRNTKRPDNNTFSELHDETTKAYKIGKDFITAENLDDLSSSLQYTGKYRNHKRLAVIVFVILREIINFFTNYLDNKHTKYRISKEMKDLKRYRLTIIALSVFICMMLVCAIVIMLIDAREHLHSSNKVVKFAVILEIIVVVIIFVMTVKFIARISAKKLVRTINYHEDFIFFLNNLRYAYGALFVVDVCIWTREILYDFLAPLRPGPVQIKQ